jgi:hypothetical protein
MVWLAALGWSTGCASSATSTSQSAPPPAAALAAAPGATKAGGCVATNGLPDTACTPGATDPAVTQANIGTTICVSGYSARVRPPPSVTDVIKRTERRAYAINAALSQVELDHLVPLGVGGLPVALNGDGSTASVQPNLWPEMRDGVNGAAAKDRLEDVLHRLVCQNRVPLTVAQQAIASDWEAAYRKYVG